MVREDGVHCDFETIIYRCTGSLGEISLNRPQRLNAVVETLCHELLQALERAEKNPEIRVIILSGQGRAFCAGADLKEHSTARRSSDDQQAYLKLLNQVCQRLYASPKIIIAAVHGYAIGAGAEFCCATDFILMQEDAQIGFPEVSLGTHVAGAVTEILPRLVGLAKARELLLLGRRIDGQEARAIGLAHRAFSPEEFTQQVEDFAHAIAAQAPISLNLTKRHLNNLAQDYAARLVSEREAIQACMRSQDWKEGIDAFTEKRRPHFKGC